MGRLESKERWIDKDREPRMDEEARELKGRR